MSDEETLWLKPLMRVMYSDGVPCRDIITLGMLSHGRPGVYNLTGDNRFVGVNEGLDDLVIKSHLASLAASTATRFILTGEYAHFADALPGRSIVMEDMLETLNGYSASDKVVIVAEQSHKGFDKFVRLVKQNEQWALFGLGFRKQKLKTYLFPAEGSAVGMVTGGKSYLYDPALLREGETYRDLFP